MDEPSRPPIGRRRWTWVLAALGLLLAAGAMTLSRLLEPERLSAFVLEQAAAATGLELAVSQPADVGLWPDLHIEMIGLRASAPGQPQPLFTAERVDLVLPWSSLLDREPVVRRLRLIGPVLQREALVSWMDSRPERPKQAFELPELTAGLDIADGAVLAEDPEAWSVQGLELATSPLRSGQPFTATLSGSLHAGSRARQLDLTLRTTPRQQDDALLLDPLWISLAPHGLPGPLELEGKLELLHPTRLALQLDGELASWPPELPALPLPGVLPLAVRLAYEGPADLSGALAVDASGTGASLHAETDVAQLLSWLRSPPGTPLPPARGRLVAERVELGPAVLQQVEIELEDVPAAAAAPQP